MARHKLLLALAGVSVLVLAAPAPAARFSAPHTLLSMKSGTALNYATPPQTVDRQGAALFAGVLGNDRLWLRDRTAAGRLLPAQVFKRDRVALDALLTTSARGDDLVTWREREAASTGYSSFLVGRGAGARRFGAPVALGAGVVVSGLGMDDSGNALLLLRRGGEGELLGSGGSVEIARRAAGGSLGPPDTVAQAGAGQATLGVGPRGDAVVAWIEPRDVNQSAGTRTDVLLAARAAPGGTFGPAQEIARHPFGGPSDNDTEVSLGLREPRAVVDRFGRATLTYLAGGVDVDGAQILSDLLAARAEPGAAFGASQQLDTGAVDSAAAAATDSGGTAFVAWTHSCRRSAARGGCDSHPRVAVVAAGARFGRARALGGLLRLWPRAPLAVDSRGTAAVVSSLTARTFAKTAPAISLRSPRASFGAVRALGPMGRHYDVSVAGGGRGTLVVTWLQAMRRGSAVRFVARR